MVDSSTRNITLQATLEESQSRATTGNVRESGSHVARKTQGACRSGIRNFLRAVRRLGFCDREEERRKDRQRIGNDSTAICALSVKRAGRSSRRDYARIEGPAKLL